MTRPVRASSRAELAEELARARAGGARVGLVPTMGALHQGHADLMTRARKELGPDGLLVVSVFVNPMQFGPHEDLDRYPRTLDSDLAMCEREGVDLVFTPAVADVYPDGEPRVTIDPGPLGDVLEGGVRPGHFRGVLTVVAKLFALVAPDVAVFGEKDYQQLVLIRRMVTDLCLPISIVGAPTRREDDRLALSSRNAYLDPAEREQATALSRALYAAQAAAGSGPDAALDAARAELRRTPDVQVDYLVLTDPDLAPLPDGAAAGSPARVLVAARVGATRLIDNLPLIVGGESEGDR